MAADAAGPIALMIALLLHTIAEFYVHAAASVYVLLMIRPVHLHRPLHSKIISHVSVHLQVAFDMRYGESSYSHQLQNSLRRSLVLASELVDGVDEAVVQIGSPSEARHLGPVVLPDAAAPLPADHRPHHGHLSASSNNTKPADQQ